MQLCTAGVKTDGSSLHGTLGLFQVQDYTLSLLKQTTKLLTAYNLKAIPEISNFNIGNYSTVPAVHQVHILVSKFLAKGFWLPEFRLELFMYP